MLHKNDILGGKYKILNQIGGGGTSIIWLAMNEAANKMWAVKEVRKAAVQDNILYEQQLITEKKLLTQLKHPNLPSIIDVIETDETTILVMDYIEGKSLQDALDQYGPQKQEDVIEWAKDLCDVLGYLHNRKNPVTGQPAPIIYRDLKPSNIMLRPDNTVCLIDFGTAREMKVDGSSKDTVPLGTIGYAAPEQYAGNNLGQTDGRTDIYCLGATLYHLVTGNSPELPPYEIRPIRDIDPSLSSGLERIILKCTQKDPGKRYQSVEELLYDLDHYNTIDDKYRKKQKRKLNLFAGVSAVSIALCITGFGLSYTAQAKATDTYAQKLEDARQTTDYDEKLSLLKECISIPDKAGVTDAYTEIIDLFRSDSSFTEEEANQLVSLIKENRKDLQQNTSNYADLCLDLGRLYWYFYDYGQNGEEYGSNQITKAISSVEWFDQVLQYADETKTDAQDSLNIAKVYSRVGSFYRTIANDVIQATDKGKYKELFDDLTILLDTVALNQSEAEIVRLELIELARNALQQYSAKFRSDGLTQAQVESMFQKTKRALQDVNPSTEATEQKWKSSNDLLDKTEEAIQLTYS